MIWLRTSRRLNILEIFFSFFLAGVKLNAAETKILIQVKWVTHKAKLSYVFKCTWNFFAPKSESESAPQKLRVRNKYPFNFINAFLC